MQSRHRTASSAGILFLYHYEKFDPDWLADTLRQQRVHCSNPANLNDPWDCMPSLDSTVLQDPIRFRQLMDWFYTDIPIDPQPPNFKELLEIRLSNDPVYAVKFMGTFSKYSQEMVASRRIYCLTPFADSTLMWSHYANNHRGICLEFSVGNDLFGSAREVEYREEYPVWLPHELAAQPTRVLELILSKASDWHYESEFRLISVEHGVCSPWHSANDDYFSLPPGALKSVIAGCAADYDAVAKVVNEHRPQVHLKRARRMPTNYRLLIE